LYAHEVLSIFYIELIMKIGQDRVPHLTVNKCIADITNSKPKEEILHPRS